MPGSRNPSMWFPQPPSRETSILYPYTWPHAPRSVARCKSSCLSSYVSLFPSPIIFPLLSSLSPSSGLSHMAWENIDIYIREALPHSSQHWTSFKGKGVWGKASLPRIKCDLQSYWLPPLHLPLSDLGTLKYFLVYKVLQLYYYLSIFCVQK